MSAATTQAPVTTAPTGTGSTIVPVLPTGHAVGDEVRIWIVNSGITTWSAPAGWTIKRQQASSGNASTGVIGTLLYHKVVAGDTLPLASPTCTLGATVTRSAVAFIVRGADLEGVHTLPEWLAFASNAGTANPVRPTTVTTLAPEMLVHIYYGSRSATTAPEQTSYTQVQQVINSGIIVNNVSERTIADQNTALSNQDASPAGGARWIAIISCTPSPDYPYYRSGSQAFNANGLNATPALPTGTTASDNRGNKDLIVATVECAGTPTIAPNTPADWTALPDWSNTTSGGGTTVRKYATLYDGSLDRQFNRSTSGEIFVYFSVYHNAHQSIPVGTSAVQQNASSTTSTFPALNRTGTKATVQATCVADATPTFTAPSGWTERNDSQGVTCADQSFNATGSTASASFTLSSASPTLCGLMEVFSVASVVNLILTPASASLTLTGFAPTIDIDITVTPGAAMLTLTTFAPTIIIPADFPITDTLDDFNRANGPLGANYGNNLFVDDGDLAIDTNLVKGTSSGSNNSQGWVTQAGPDCEAFIEIVSGADTHRALVAVRFSALGTADPDGYSARALGGATNNILVLRFDNGSPVILDTISQTVDDGDWLGIRIVDDTITVFYKDISVSSDWVEVGEVVDATYSAAGYFGPLVEGDVGRIDNFGGGTIGAIVVTPTSASLALSAFAPQLRVVLTPASASLALTTFAPSVTIKVTVPAASLSLTTFAPVVTATANVTVTPAAASLTLTSFAVQLREVVTPANQSLTLTTFAVKLVQVITPGSASLLLTAFAPTVRTNTIITPASSALTLTTNAPQLREAVIPNAASLSLASFAPTVTATAHVTVTPAAASLSATGFAPQLRQRVTPSAATLTLTTFAPEITISADITVTPAAQTLALTGFAPSLQLVVAPATVTLSLSTFAPTITISADQVVTPAPATLVLTAFAPELRLVATPATATLSLSASAPVLVLEVRPDATALTLTTFAPTLTTGGDVTFTPAHASLTLVTFAPTVTTGAQVTTVTPAAATLTLTSYAPWLFLGLVPANRTFVVESGTYEVEVGAGDYEFLDEYEDDEVFVS